MTTTYNIYCDESCHLEHDRQTVMVLGAVWCPLEKVREISARIRGIKTWHGLSPRFELNLNPSAENCGRRGMSTTKCKNRLFRRLKNSFYTWQMSYYYDNNIA